MLQSSLLSKVPGIRHGFGSIIEPFPKPSHERWKQIGPRKKQVHGTDLAEVTGPGQECGDVDGVFTTALDLPISVISADCVPILLARDDGSAVCAIHSGWRGTIARILERAMEKLPRGRWVGAVGPSIGPCCYEVSEELAEKFVQEFREHPSGLILPEHRKLDLPAIAEVELKRLGVTQVEVLRACTQCSKDAAGKPIFHSFRREGAGTRQHSVIERSSLSG